MNILNKDECKKVNDVVEYITTHYGLSVDEIKKKFHLTSEEYEMISDLMMPSIRRQNRIKHLEDGIRKLIKTYTGQDLEEENNGYSEEEDMPA